MPEGVPMIGLRPGGVPVINAPVRADGMASEHVLSPLVPSVSQLELNRRARSRRNSLADEPLFPVKPIHVLAVEGDLEGMRHAARRHATGAGARVSRSGSGRNSLNLMHQRVVRQRLAVESESGADLSDDSELSVSDDCKKPLRDVADDDGWNALHWAASAGQDDMVRMLVKEFGFDVNSRDLEGCTPLHWAADKGHKRTILVLCSELGADVNAVDNYGQTPLYDASSRVQNDVITLLISELEASPHIASNTGKKPIDVYNEMIRSQAIAGDPDLVTRTRRAPAPRLRRPPRLQRLVAPRQ
ncbi:ankyrin domain-containing protein [Thecamonas trahens ATCC 50062]|uniref:Ankyrin domain-containing protein n=1 Tax=Thecamonas trahens ATCC 50062 TaxID=461836 RepID=A0A0L0DAV2_THETB|nr:ankyrin domain-containing protein [Thecamonas trahens ATCC 50062]KNC49462.1 ankyrin domain-containing protein [Thecamonas trahens ATCC 50062]|eukprot:XP_013757881.1 ankyrin domain-containing protein [Thecamonas trahens ATCC 50062]